MCQKEFQARNLYLGPPRVQSKRRLYGTPNNLREQAVRLIGIYLGPPRVQSNRLYRVAKQLAGASRKTNSNSPPLGRISREMTAVRAFYTFQQSLV